jgi:ubiquinol-cytochrome c reductase cytochrome c1 subunit
MIARFKMTIAVAALAGLLGYPVAEASAAGEVTPPPSRSWSFEGVFGTFDKAELQRGFQVYSQGCAGCHGLDQLAYRNLSALGYNEDEVKAIAAQTFVMDGPNEEGEMFERAGRPSDKFMNPFPNEQAARYANGGALPPDLSTIIKARPGGADYVHAILVGYDDAPSDMTIPPGQWYNTYMPGNRIAMPPPLYPDGVAYEDGTPATIEQQAHDVAVFLTWASHPDMDERKTAGVMTILFLIVFTGLLYATKRKIWANVH